MLVRHSFWPQLLFIQRFSFTSTFKAFHYFEIKGEIKDPLATAAPPMEQPESIKAIKPTKLEPSTAVTKPIAFVIGLFHLITIGWG